MKIYIKDLQSRLLASWSPSLTHVSFSVRNIHASVLSRFSSVELLATPPDCSPPSSSVHGILQAKSGVGCYFLLQGIFPTQGSNPRLFHLLHWQVGSLPLGPPRKPTSWCYFYTHYVTVNLIVDAHRIRILFL